MIEVTRHGSRGDVEPVFPGSCWRSVNARYGLRGVRVGEASHSSETVTWPRLLRRLRRGRSRGARAEISDEEVLARHSRRHVVPRIDGVASVADVTQIDVVDVEDLSTVAPTLLDSLAETPPAHTNLRDVVDQILPGTDRDRGADDCSSASSKSCWGEMEEIGDDEEVEWGTLPRPPSGQADDRVGLREDIHDRPGFDDCS